MDLPMDPVTANAGASAEYEGDNQTQHMQHAHQQQQYQQQMQEDGDHMQQHHQEQHHQEQQVLQLTDAVRTGLEAVGSRKQEIYAKIDDLCTAGLQFLEATKMNFQQLIENFKKDIDDFCEGVVANNSMESEETIKAMARLERAQQLVQSLGLAAADPGVQI